MEQLLDVNDPSFTKTHWSWVIAAVRTDSREGENALARLCERYWYPLYVYLRRRGYNHEDAQDLVQGFFARLLEKNYLRNANPEKGTFRTFLLLTLNRFRVNEWERMQSQKRGGGVQIVSLNGKDTENRYLREPVDPRTPEKAYEVRWANLLLGRVLDRLEKEYSSAGKAAVFSELKVFLTGEKRESTYAAIAQRLGMTECNLKVSVHRIRKSYREFLREEIAETVVSPDQIDDEIRHLRTALS